jgi:membrane protein
LLYAATGLFAQLKFSLNSIWHVSAQTQGGVIGFVKTRLLAFLLVLGTGLVLILAVLGSVVGSFMTAWTGFGGKLVTGNVVTFAVLSMLCFVLLYRILPDRRIAWGDVWMGGFVAALLFTIGRWGLGIYLSHSTVSSAFAAAGTLAIVLIAINYSAQIFLFGALFGRVYATTYGSQVGSATAGVDKV